MKPLRVASLVWIGKNCPIQTRVGNDKTTRTNLY
jgi:hypothetical protein